MGRRDIAATREELEELAHELGLDLRSESKALLYHRILQRAGVLWRLAVAEEASDPERTEWPWTE